MSSPASFLQHQTQTINSQQRKVVLSHETPTLLNSLLQKPPTVIPTAVALASVPSNNLPPTPPLGAGVGPVVPGGSGELPSAVPPNGGNGPYGGLPPTGVDQRWTSAYQHGRYVQQGPAVEMTRFASEMNHLKPMVGPLSQGLVPSHFAGLPIRPFPSGVQSSAATYAAGYPSHPSNYCGPMNMPMVPSPTAGTPPAIRFGYPMEISSNGGEAKRKFSSSTSKQHRSVAALRHDLCGSSSAPTSNVAAVGSPVGNDSSAASNSSAALAQHMRHSPVSPAAMPAYSAPYNHPGHSSGSPFVQAHLQPPPNVGLNPGSPYGSQPLTPGGLPTSTTHRQRPATFTPTAASMNQKVTGYFPANRADFPGTANQKDYCASLNQKEYGRTIMAPHMTNGVIYQQPQNFHGLDERSFGERQNGRNTPSVASSESRLTSTPVDSKPPRLTSGAKDSHPSTPAMNSPGETSSAIDDMESSLSSPSWPRTPMSPANSTRHSNSQTSFVTGRPSTHSNGSALQSSREPQFSGLQPTPSSSSASFQATAGLAPPGRLTPSQATLVERLVGDFRINANNFQEWEDRRRFFEHYVLFCDQNPSAAGAVQISEHPSVSKQPVDLYVLYRFVKQHGGYVHCTKGKTWRHMCKLFNVNESNSASGQIKKQYAKHLLPYECYYELNRADPEPIIRACESKKKSKSKLQHGDATSAPSVHQNLPAAYPPPPNHGGLPGGPPHFTGVLPPGFNSHHQLPPNFHHHNLQQQQGQSFFVSHQQQQLQSPHQHQNQQNQPPPRPNSTQSNAPSVSSSSSAATNFNDAPTPVVLLPQGRGRPPKPGSKRAAAREAAAAMAAVAAAGGTSAPASGGPAANVADPPPLPTRQSVETAVNPFDDSQMTGAPPSSRVLPVDREQPPRNKAPPLSNTQEQPWAPLTPQQPNVASASGAITTSSLRPVLAGSQLPQAGAYGNLAAPCHNVPGVVGGEPLPTSTQGAPFLTPQPQRQPSQQTFYPNQSPNAPPPQLTPPQQSAAGALQVPHSNGVYYGQHQGQVGHSQPSMQRFGHQVASSSSNQTFEKFQGRIPVPPQHHHFVQCQGSGNSFPYNSMNASSAYTQGRIADIALKVNVTRGGSMPVLSPRSDMPMLPSPVNTTCVEMTSFKGVKRRRLMARDIEKVDVWRLVMALKSGLCFEGCWALNVLTVLLFDDSTLAFFDLDKMPGFCAALLGVLRQNLLGFVRQTMPSSEKVFFSTASPPSSAEATRAKSPEPPSASSTSFDRSAATPSQRPTQSNRPTPTVRFVDADDSAVMASYAAGDFSMTAASTSLAREFDRLIAHVTSKRKRRRLDDGGKVDDSDDVDEFALRAPLLTLFTSTMTSSARLHLDACQCVTNALRTLLGAADNERRVVNDRRICADLLGVCVDLIRLGEECLAADQPAIRRPPEGLPSTDVVESKLKTLKPNGGSKINNETAPGKITEKLCDSPNVHPVDVDDSSVKKITKSPPNMLIDCANSQGSEFSHALKENALVLLTNESQTTAAPSSDVQMLAIPASDDSVVISPADVTLKTTADTCGDYSDEGASILAANASSIDVKPHQSTLEDAALTSCATEAPTAEDSLWFYDDVLRMCDDAFVVLCHLSAYVDLCDYNEKLVESLLSSTLAFALMRTPGGGQDLMPASAHLAPVDFPLTPLNRCALEVLCKLTVFERNMDLLLATPPWSRVERLLVRLSTYLAPGQEVVLAEFSLVLSNALCQASQEVCLVLALQTPFISRLSTFLNCADTEMHKVVQMHGMQALRDNPEIIGTSVGMLRRAASTLLCMARVPQCRPGFAGQTSNFLVITTSSLTDTRVGLIMADVLFELSKH